jgi:hypothetical protein
MMKACSRIDKYLLLAVLTLSCSAMVGCEYFPESTLELASESRLPRWITLPAGDTRADVSVTMSYYDNLWGSNVKVIFQDHQKETKVYGKENDQGPFRLKLPPSGFPPGYPLYEIITANGVTEIIEHRKMEPLFYVTDDPAVWKELMGVQHSPPS